MSVELWFSSSDSEDEDYGDLAIERKRIRDHSDPLDQPEKTFIQYFRISKPIFTYLLEILDGRIASSSIPPTLMLAASLRFFAEGGYQKGVGNDRYIGMAQPTISKTLSLVLNVFENEVIQFPVEENEKNAIRLGFYEKAGFPGVLGVVDGTHVRIIPPAANKHLYYNRR